MYNMPQHPSNIISGTYINSNIIVHNPASTSTKNKSFAKRQPKVKLTHQSVDQQIRHRNHSMDTRNGRLQANLVASTLNLTLKQKKNGAKQTKSPNDLNFTTALQPNIVNQILSKKQQSQLQQPSKSLQQTVVLSKKTSLPRAVSVMDGSTNLKPILFESQRHISSMDL